MQEENCKIAECLPNYVLIDAALWENDINVAKRHNPNFRSLFRGKIGEELSSVAPFLFEITNDMVRSDFGHWIAVKINREPILRRVLWIQSNATIDILRQHLKRFLRVKISSGKYLYLRIYDPYVINCVLPILNKEQLSELFSKIESIVSEDIRINERRTFALSSSGELLITYSKLN